MRFSLLPLALVLALLTSCADPAAETPTPQPTEIPAMESPAAESSVPFDIQTPIVFASYPYRTETAMKTLLLECTSGTYSSMGENWNRAWSGAFRFRLADGYSVSLTDEGGVTSCEMELSFNGPFPLYVDDYNDDGQPDFALTQWGSASGGDYGKIFTLNPDGTVAELPVSGDLRVIGSFGTLDTAETESGCFTLPQQHTAGSVELEKVDGGFVVSTYNPFVRGPFAEGICFLLDEEEIDYSANWLEDVYLWDGSAFVLTEQRLLYKNLEGE